MRRLADLGDFLWQSCDFKVLIIKQCGTLASELARQNIARGITIKCSRALLRGRTEWREPVSVIFRICAWIFNPHEIGFIGLGFDEYKSIRRHPFTSEKKTTISLSKRICKNLNKWAPLIRLIKATLTNNATIQQLYYNITTSQATKIL